MYAEFTLSPAQLPAAQAGAQDGDGAAQQQPHDQDDEQHRPNGLDQPDGDVDGQRAHQQSKARPERSVQPGARIAGAQGRSCRAALRTASEAVA